VRLQLELRLRLRLRLRLQLRLRLRLRQDRRVGRVRLQLGLGLQLRSVIGISVPGDPASDEDRYPVIDPVDDQPARGGLFFKEKLEEDRPRGLGQVLVRSTPPAEVCLDVRVRLLVEWQVSPRERHVVVRLLQVDGRLLQVVGCIRVGGGHFLRESGRLRLDPNRGKVFHNLAENSRISTGPPANPCEKRILYKSHDVASNVGGYDRPTDVGDVGVCDRPTDVGDVGVRDIPTDVGDVGDVPKVQNFHRASGRPVQKTNFI
jgi:hypothetical protein